MLELLLYYILSDFGCALHIEFFVRVLLVLVFAADGVYDFSWSESCLLCIPCDGSWLCSDGFLEGSCFIRGVLPGYLDEALCGVYKSDLIDFSDVEFLEVDVDLCGDLDFHISGVLFVPLDEEILVVDSREVVVYCFSSDVVLLAVVARYSVADIDCRVGSVGEHSMCEK